MPSGLPIGPQLGPNDFQRTRKDMPHGKRDRIMITVCSRIASGELVDDVCKDLQVLPQQVRKWANRPRYSALYSRARENQAHALAEAVIQIADGRDTEASATLQAVALETLGLDPAFRQQIINGLLHNAVQRDKLRFSARTWYVSKIASKLYGDRVGIDYTVDVSRLTIAELELLAAGKPLKALNPANSIDP